MAEITIREACEIFLLRYCYDGSINPNPSTIEKICKEVDTWVGTPAEEYVSSLVWRVHGVTNSGEFVFKQTLDSLLQPIAERRKDKKFFHDRHNDFNQTPFYADFEGGDYSYVYVHSEIEGRFGKQFWVSVNCENGLVLTYTRKQLNEELEVGKFYKIRIEDVIYFGNNRKKFVYKIEEISEEDFLYYGVRAGNIG